MDPLIKKMGVFGGSFDPVHFGHINLALSMMELCGLDGVFFVPAGISPFKEGAPPVASAKDRLGMLKCALAPIQGFHVVDWELNSQGPSYAIHTVRKLAEDRSLELHLLLGSDHVTSLHLWKEVGELLRLAPPLIGIRSGDSLAERSPLVGKKVLTPLFDISSTSIRRRLSQKKYCGHLVPSSVLDYIADHGLY